jgi:hypothetical protein
MHPKREAIQKDKNFETCKSPNSRSQLPGLVCLEIHQGQPGRPPARTQVAALVVVVIMLNCLCKQAHEDRPRADGKPAMPTGLMTTKEFNMGWSLSQTIVQTLTRPPRLHWLDPDRGSESIGKQHRQRTSVQALGIHPVLNACAQSGRSRFSAKSAMDSWS